MNILYLHQRMLHSSCILCIDLCLDHSHPMKRVGPYLIGPRLGSSPVSSITQCLARKSGSDQFYTLKVGFNKQLILTSTLTPPNFI